MDISIYFPFGVRMFYKLYSAEKVVVILPDPTDTLLGIKAWDCCPKWLPEAICDDDGTIRRPPGMKILWRFPTGMLKPEPLVPGSHMTLQRVYYAILMRWRGKNDLERHIINWDDYLDIAPTSDDVEEYLKDKST